eukprot:TRINITY_DN111287_c0_g1_i1.p1 TRINITY_DN111287_c0_g1~~TRINITY_DN111287_c0_g1_i1.p1  ORF type:complete len:107 (-),score=3.26 TRINITY_DN111287_c0_g1_i1:49-369(-)
MFVGCVTCDGADVSPKLSRIVQVHQWPLHLIRLGMLAYLKLGKLHRLTGADCAASFIDASSLVLPSGDRDCIIVAFSVLSLVHALHMLYTDILRPFRSCCASAWRS